MSEAADRTGQCEPSATRQFYHWLKFAMLSKADAHVD